MSRGLVPYRFQAVCRPHYSRHVLPDIMIWFYSGSRTLISILFPDTLDQAAAGSRPPMHAGGFLFYRRCLIDVHRREWRLTCRIRRLRQLPQELFPVSRVLTSSPPSSLPPGFSYVIARGTITSKICHEQFRFGLLSYMGRPTPLHRRPAWCPLGSSWARPFTNSDTKS